MQDDDTANPGMLWVLDGEALWKQQDRRRRQGLRRLPQDARASMKGVAARYPAFDKTLGRPVNLEQRINLCRARHQQATPLAYESRDLLALTAFVARAVARRADRRPAADPQLAAVRRQRARAVHAAAGPAQSRLRQLPRRQLGQAAGGIRRSRKAHPTGYPLYRLEWQSLGSLQRRLRSCITGIRAQPYDYGAPELVELELYLMSRARGMPIETPAVRP